MINLYIVTQDTGKGHLKSSILDGSFTKIFNHHQEKKSKFNKITPKIISLKSLFCIL